MTQGIFSSLGIGSGLDSTSLVDQLVAAQRRPREMQFAQAEQSLTARLSAFGMLAAVLDKVGSTAKGLTGLADGRVARISQSGILTARAEPAAQTGSYTVEVHQLARAQSLASAEYASTDTAVSTGTISLSIGIADPVDISIDSSNNTLAGVRDAINAAGVDVTANIVNNGSGYQLLISSDATGQANSIEISVVDDDPASDPEGNNPDSQGLYAFAYNEDHKNMIETRAAQDAQLNVNGLTVFRANNQIDDLIDGLTLSLQKADPDAQVRIDIQNDRASVTDAASSFASALGGLGKQLDALMRFDPETGKSGALQGDSAARALQSRIRDGLVTEMQASGNYNSLIDIGFSTSRGGEITFDKAAFEAALDSDYEGVMGLLTQASAHFGNLVQAFGEQSGLLGARTASIQSRLEGIADQRQDLERRMEMVEARLRREFSALDSLISGLQNTGDFLTRQLDTLPLPGRKK